MIALGANAERTHGTGPLSDTSIEALADLRGTAKWLASASAAIVAIMVGGLQLRDVGAAASRGRLDVALAVASLVLALGLAVAVILIAGSVLTTPRPTVRDLSNREMKSGGVSTKVALEPLDDKTIQKLREQRSDLLGGFTSIHDFYIYAQECDGARGRFLLGENASVRGAQFDVNMESDRARLYAVCHETLVRADRLERVAQFLEVSHRFSRLMKSIGIGSILFVVALLAFSWFTRPAASTSSDVIRPMAANVYVINSTEAGLPSSCSARMLRGVAVGGTLTEPIVITEPSKGCPSMRLTAGPGLNLVPLPD